jgi:hypothetical protein
MLDFSKCMKASGLSVGMCINPSFEDLARARQRRSVASPDQCLLLGADEKGSYSSRILLYDLVRTPEKTRETHDYL